MTPWGYEHVWGDPAGCCRGLVSSGAVTHVTLTLFQRVRRLVTLEARFEPPLGFVDFPEETTRITVFDDRSVVTVPGGDAGRPWRHRYPRMSIAVLIGHLASTTAPEWLRVFGALCLEFPGDPGRLRWSWARGFDIYLQMVQRHLLAEEFARRYGEWPVEEAPHGERADGRPHPLLTPMFRAA